MSEEIKEEIKEVKERKSRKVEVEVIRRCSDEDGNEFAAGDKTKMSRDLAKKFQDAGVVKAVL